MINDELGLLVPVDAVHAPWTAEQVRRLNLRQSDDRVASYECPHDRVNLFATRCGWICAKKHCRFRQGWALSRHLNYPYVPPPRTGS